MKLKSLEAVTYTHTQVTIKRNIFFILISLLLLLLNLMISTTSYSVWNLSLQFPIRSVYGNISWGITIFFGVIETIVIMILISKQISLDKVFLCIAIPIGLLYCFSNPLGKIPDEDFHARKVMAIASRTLFFYCK